MTIIIFDLALEKDPFEEKKKNFNTQVREFHILFTDGTTDYVAAKDFDTIDIIFCKVFSELVHSVHSLFICVSCFNGFIYFSPFKFYLALASSLGIVLKLFLIFEKSEENKNVRGMGSHLKYAQLRT